MELGWLSKFLRGRKCVFCGQSKPYYLRDKRVKWPKCRRKYSLKKLKTDLEV